MMLWLKSHADPASRPEPSVKRTYLWTGTNWKFCWADLLASV